MNLSPATCHLRPVTCYLTRKQHLNLSPATCHLSCHLSCQVICHLSCHLICQVIETLLAGRQAVLRTCARIAAARGGGAERAFEDILLGMLKVCPT